MGIDITKENKIKQNINFCLEGEELKEFISLLKTFLEEKSKQTIEGEIEKIYLSHNKNYSSTDVEITTLKEDKLKMITMD